MRAQHFPHQSRYEYQPLKHETEQNRWSDVQRERVLNNYNLRDMGI